MHIRSQVLDLSSAVSILQLEDLTFEHGVQAHRLNVICLLALNPSLEQIKLGLEILHFSILLAQLLSQLILLLL